MECRFLTWPGIVYLQYCICFEKCQLKHLNAAQLLQRCRARAEHLRRDFGNIASPQDLFLRAEFAFPQQSAVAPPSPGQGRKITASEAVTGCKSVQTYL